MPLGIWSLQQSLDLILTTSHRNARSLSVLGALVVDLPDEDSEASCRDLKPGDWGAVAQTEKSEVRSSKEEGESSKFEV